MKKINKNTDFKNSMLMLNLYDYYYDDKKTVEENYYYEIDEEQFLKIKDITENIFINVKNVLKNILIENPFHYSDEILKILKESYTKNNKSFLTRFDFYYDGNDLKLYEVNTETPTLLYESYFYQEILSKSLKVKNYNSDIINNIENYFSIIPQTEIIDFATSYLFSDDYHTTKFINSIIKNTYRTRMNEKNDIYILENEVLTKDLKEIKNLFRFFRLDELEVSYVKNLLNINLFDPLWTHIISDKRIMTKINNENVLKTSESIIDIIRNNNLNYVKKLALSAQSQGIKIVENGEILLDNTKYNNDIYIYQELKKPIKSDNHYLTISTWMINEKFSGIVFKESENLINQNTKIVPYNVVNNI